VELNPIVEGAGLVEDDALCTALKRLKNLIVEKKGEEGCRRKYSVEMGHLKAEPRTDAYKQRGSSNIKVVMVRILVSNKLR
jgi:hypothetical protein